MAKPYTTLNPLSAAAALPAASSDQIAFRQFGDV